MKKYVKLPMGCLAAMDGNSLYRTLQLNALIKKRNSYLPEDSQTRHSYIVLNFTRKTGLRATIHQPTVSTKSLLGLLSPQSRKTLAQAQFRQSTRKKLG